MKDENQSNQSPRRYKNLIFADDGPEKLVEYGVSQEMIAQTINTPDTRIQAEKNGDLEQKRIYQFYKIQYGLGESDVFFIRRFTEHEVNAIASLAEDEFTWKVRKVWGYYRYKEFIFPISILAQMKSLHISLDMVIAAIQHPDRREAEKERGDIEPEATYLKNFNNVRLLVDAFLDEDRLKIMVTNVQSLPTDNWWHRMLDAILH